MILLHRIDYYNNKGAAVSIPEENIAFLEERVFHTFRGPMGTKVHVISGEVIDVYESLADVQKMLRGETEKVMS